MSEKKLEPKLITVLREGYTFSHFSKDLTAGVIVGIVALPLAIAFAIASGVKPEQGLYTAIIAGFLISALSGSRVQIGCRAGHRARSLDRLRHRSAIRIRRAGDSNAYLRNFVDCDGFRAAGCGHQIYPLPRHCRFHNRYRVDYFCRTNPRFFGIGHRHRSIGIH